MRNNKYRSEIETYLRVGVVCLTSRISEVCIAGIVRADKRNTQRQPLAAKERREREGG
jgi:hypothetical protein